MGDLDRLTSLVVERAAGLSLYARQWLDRVSADDVVQEALTDLLALRREPDDPVAWMFKAVRNRAIDYARSTSRRRRREQTVARGRAEWFESTPDSLIDARTAEQALARLPEEFRQIVVLRIWGGLSFNQVAQVVQLSASTAHDRYVWALEQMRIVLEKPCKSRMD